jgi:Rieske 2Fe-2S family protein
MSPLDVNERTSLMNLVDSRQPGHGLPRDFYHNDSLYNFEMEHIWRQGWLFAGHSCQIPNPGDYFVYEMELDPIIVVRGDERQVNAFHNVCRHRGSLICHEAQGNIKRFICPYHQWTYDRNGQLLLQHGMQADLDKSQLGLHRVHAREVEGMIFISLSQQPVDFDPVFDAIAPVARLQGLARARVARIMDFDVASNWKLVWENNRECFHCNVNHPQYIKANFDHYNADDTTARIAERLKSVTTRLEAKLAAQGMSVRDATGMTEFPDPDHGLWYAANRTPLKEGYVSESMDGKQVAPLMGDYTDPDVGTLRIRSLPNFWIHASCDHSVAVRLTPNGLTHTSIRMTWLVDGKAESGRDYDLDKLLPFWLLTAEQDWKICTTQQRGVNSHAYTPGPLSTFKEYNLDRFLRWYLQEIKASLEK